MVLVRLKKKEELPAKKTLIMKKERFVLSFVAVLIGLLVAAIIFYLYQATRAIPSSKVTNIALNPTTTPKPQGSFYLTIDQPTDQSVVTGKTITVSGKADPNATVTVITPLDQQIVSPSSTGSFSTTVTIDSGENFVEITAIGADGQQVTTQRTVTFSTESF